MEQLQFDYAAGQPAAGRALAGVVASGDLEVLLEPAPAGRTTVLVQTSVNGFGATWRAVLDRLFSADPLPAARIEIHDSGATPGVVRMRLQQAYEQAGDAARGTANDTATDAAKDTAKDTAKETVKDTAAGQSGPGNTVTGQP